MICRRCGKYELFHWCKVWEQEVLEERYVPKHMKRN